ncbi:MAG: hypothetical protein AB1806_07865 [Acidobacteriota bacterium]
MNRHLQRYDLAGVAVVHAALAVLATWPLVRRLGWALPGDLGDPLLNTFILGWDADRLLHGLRGLWDAPPFFPFRQTLAFSEHLLGVAIFTAPLQWITGNPVLAYNVAFLGSPVLAGTGMYGLARELWGRRDAAWVAAVAFAFAPHRVMNVSHLQVLMSGWMPIALWALHRYFRTGSRRALGGFVVAFCLQGLSNGYFLYFFAVAVVVIGGIEFAGLLRPGRASPIKPIRPGRAAADLAVGAVIVGLVFTPVALAYYGVQRDLGFRRAVSEAKLYAAKPGDYLRADADLTIWGRTLDEAPAERSVFPGVTIVVLAGLGFVTLLAKPGNGHCAGWRRHVSAYAGVVVVAFWLSLGPGHGPYGWLMSVVPGFNGLRVPARFVVVVALGLAALGGAGAAWAFRQPFVRRRPASLAVVLASLVFAEGYGGLLRLEPFDPDQRPRAALHAWLAGRPAGAMLELPIAGPHLERFTLPYQYNTLKHGRRIVNGYSGWGSALQDFLSELSLPQGSQEEFDALLGGLSRIGIRYIVVHRIEFEEQWPKTHDDLQRLTRALEQSPWVVAGETLLPVDAWQLKDPAVPGPAATDGLHALSAGYDFALTSPDHPDRLVYLTDGDPRSGWKTEAPQKGGEWIEIAFARLRDLARIDFETSVVRSGGYPRGLRVESLGADGDAAVLFEGSVIPLLIEGLVRAPRLPAIELALPPNESQLIRIWQTGRRSVQWEISDIRIWAR